MMNNLVDEMIASTGSAVAAYQKYVLSHSKYFNTLFFFVEGEDFCYYNERIRQFSNYENYIHYNCNGKKNVIETKLLIDKESDVNNNSCMYFVDRDFDFEIIPSGIYITEWYSIENFYLTKNVVEQVMENMMEINKNTKNYLLGISYFDKTYYEYSKFGKLINSFFYSVREYEKTNRLPRSDLNIKKLKFFTDNSGLDNYSFKKLTYDELKKIYNLEEYQIPEKQFVINTLKFDTDNHYNFRGKFELEFLKWFLYELRICIMNGILGFEKNGDVCSYDFQTDTMKILSKFAYTPSNLKKYIEENNLIENELSTEK